MRMSKDEMAGAEFQMHRNSGDLILTRDDVGFNDSGMLLKGELKKVSYGRIVHRHIDTFLWRLNETKLALVGIDCFGGKPDTPIAERVAKMRKYLIPRQGSHPEMLGLRARFGRRWIEVSKVGVIDGFDRQGGTIVQSAIEGESPILQSDRRRKSHRQYAAVFADQVLPLQPHLIIGDFLYHSCALLRSENEVRASLRQRSV